MYGSVHSKAHIVLAISAGESLDTWLFDSVLFFILRPVDLPFLFRHFSSRFIELRLSLVAYVTTLLAAVFAVQVFVLTL